MSPLKKIDWKHLLSWKRLYDYFFLRAVLGLLGFRHPGFTASHTFIPFFQYKIGPYETDYYLHFRSQPTFLRYTIEFFEKMKEYTGHALVGFLEFHYNAYADKKEFLRFLRYEVAHSMNSKTPQHYKIRVETILAWVAEQENILGMYSGQSLQPALPPPGPSLGHLAPPALFPPASAILDNPSVRETIADSIENMIPPLISTYQGNIILTHNQHTERLIQLFIILKDLKAPGKRGENLFKSFYNTDMVAILRQLEIYSDKKANTIQGKITEANDNLNYNDPKVEKLLKALTDFFYGPHS